jgi:hypothetical protein
MATGAKCGGGVNVRLEFRGVSLGIVDSTIGSAIRSSWTTFWALVWISVWTVVWALVWISVWISARVCASTRISSKGFPASNKSGKAALLRFGLARFLTFDITIMQLEDNQLIRLEDNQLMPQQDNQLIPLEDDSIVTDIAQDYFDLLQTSNNINQLVTTTHLSKFYNPKNWKIVVGCLSRLDEPLVAKLVRDLDSCLHLPIEIFIDQLLNRGHIALVFENLNYRNFISILVKLPKRNLLKVCKHLVDHDIQPLVTPEIVFDLVRDLNISRKVICSIIAVSSKSILLDLTRVWSNCVFVDSAPILYQVRIAAALVCAADLHPFDSESSMLFMKSIGNFLAASRVETRELGMTVAEIITQKLGQAKLEFDIESRYKWLADRSADEIKQPKIEVKSQHVPKGKSIISMVDDINPDESVLTRSNLEFPKKNPRTKSVPWFLPEALRMLGDRDGCLDALLYIPRLIEQASQVELGDQI